MRAYSNGSLVECSRCSGTEFALWGSCTATHDTICSKFPSLSLCFLTIHHAYEAWKANSESPSILHLRAFLCVLLSVPFIFESLLALTLWLIYRMKRHHTSLRNQTQLTLDHVKWAPFVLSVVLVLVVALWAVRTNFPHRLKGTHPVSKHE